MIEGSSEEKEGETKREKRTQRSKEKRTGLRMFGHKLIDGQGFSASENNLELVCKYSPTSPPPFPSPLKGEGTPFIPSCFPSPLAGEGRVRGI
jgi:hypothetical protein